MKLKLNISIKEKILVPIVILAMLAIAAVASVSYYYSTKALKKSYFDSMEYMTTSMLTQLNDYANERIALVQLSCKRAVFVNPFLDGFSPQSVAAANKQMIDMAAAYQDYESIAIADKSGILRAANNTELVNKLNIADRNYFQKAIKGESSIEDIVISKATNNVVWVIAEPVKVGDEVVGMFLAIVEIGNFADKYFASISVGESGYAFMTKGDGLIIAHPEKEAVLTANLFDTPHGKIMGERKNGRLEYEWKGVDKIAAFGQVDKTGWIVAITATTAELFADVNSIRIISLVISLAAIALLSILGYLIITPVTVGIKLAADHARRQAGGDFTTSVPSSQLRRRDEIGILANAFKDMKEAISDIVNNINNNAVTLAGAAEEVNSTSQSLSEGSNEQAASVEETSSTIEEISSTVAQNAENAKITDDIARTTAEQAGKGGAAVKQTVEAMNKIADTISVVEDIAYQTNLLALNAAIEAARAGEHGKGFSVVASEVRKLAEKSQEASAKISELAGSSVDIANDAGKLLDEMIPSIQKTADLVQGISSASEQQADGIEQINSGMNQLSQVSTATASASEELASTSEQMSQQAQALQKMLLFFKTEETDIAAK